MILAWRPGIGIAIASGHSAVEVTLLGRTQYQLGLELTKKQRQEGTKSIELVWRQDQVASEQSRAVVSWLSLGALSGSH